MDEKSTLKKVQSYLKEPKVILARKLWTSEGYLANIEMFVFAKLGLSWDEVLLYNPEFNAHRTSAQYDQMVAFVNEDSEEYYKAQKKLLKVVSILDEVCDTNKNNRSEFKKIE